MNTQRAPAVFLDRDGTLIEEVGYAARIEELVPFPFTIEALGALKSAGFRLIVISNQAGVARGLIDPAFPEIAFRHLHATLVSNGTRLLSAGYYCPHHPDATVAEYRVVCGCRKPATGMIEQAMRDFDIDMTRSYMVGDHVSDVEAGHRAGLASVLLLTGHGKDEAGKLITEETRPQPAFIASDLLAATRWILDRHRSAEAAEAAE